MFDFCVKRTTDHARPSPRRPDPLSPAGDAGLRRAAMIARGVLPAWTRRQRAAGHSTAPFEPLHAVLALPQPALPLSRTPWSERARRRVVPGAARCHAAAAAGWAVLSQRGAARSRGSAVHERATVARARRGGGRPTAVARA